MKYFNIFGPALLLCLAAAAPAKEVDPSPTAIASPGAPDSAPSVDPASIPRVVTFGKNNESDAESQEDPADLTNASPSDVPGVNEVVFTGNHKLPKQGE